MLGGKNWRAGAQKWQYLWNALRWKKSYYGGPIGSHQRSFEWYHPRLPMTSPSIDYSEKYVLLTRSPAVARDGRPYWPSRKTVIPSGIDLAAVLGVGQLSWLVKLIVHWLTAYCPSTLSCHASCYKQCLPSAYSRVTQAAPIILTNIHSSYAVIWMQVTTISDVGFSLSCYVMQTNKRPNEQNRHFSLNHFTAMEN